MISYRVAWTAVLLVFHVTQGALYNAAHSISARQSSTAHGGIANRAIDGNTNGQWNGGSCTHTNCGGIQWIEFDLGMVHQIHHISIWGRTDCCSEKLLGAKLKIGHNMCGTLKNMGKVGGPDNITCAQNIMRGQKVRIEQKGVCLTVCEIQVWVNDTTNGEKDPDEPSTIAYIGGEQGGNYTNVAYLKNTKQSSIGWGGESSRAVDGYTLTEWRQLSCTHTLDKTAEYWEVDLGRSYEIDHILVWGRTDCCSEKLQGAKLLIGGTECGVLANKGKTGNPDKITCPGISKGRVVRVELYKTYLTLCEVQVMVKNENLDKEPSTIESLGQYVEGLKYINVAAGKNTTQSSDWSNSYLSNLAVDGMPSEQDSGRGSCSHTRGENSWWQVDLGKTYQIAEIRVYGRINCCTDQLDKGTVYIGNNLCGYLTDNKRKSGYHDVIKCDHMTGRKVKIKILGPHLVLCEVQVLVLADDMKNEEILPTAPSNGIVTIINNIKYYNVAQNKPALQSSTGWDGIAGRAVDGHPTLQKYPSKSCSHTSSRSGEQWWEVDLGRVYEIDRILVYGRTDCCTDSIVGARVRIGHHVCGTLVDKGKEGAPNNITCSNPQYSKGRRVRIDQINNYLTLCEVQVLVRADKLDAEHPTVLPQYTNVAIKRATNQSSTAHGGVSSRGVDGWSKALHWNYGSCTHTLVAELNWWEVDLGEEYVIDRIEIYGRSDCCQYRLKDAIVLLDDKTMAGLSYYDGQTYWNISINNRKGRKVKITKLGDVLTVCEVRVLVNNYYDERDDDTITMTNIALNKTSDSSSVSYGGTADLAVDGNTEANFYRGSCMMTGPTQGDSWWKVDLGHAKKIGLIEIYPRLDSYRRSTIDNAIIRAGQHHCATITYNPDQHMYTVNCGGATSSTVKISKTGFLSLCEVKVYEVKNTRDK